MSPRPLRSPDEVHRLYPPRASRSVAPRNLNRLRGFVAQYKYYDIRILILLLPMHRVELMTRQRKPLLEYTLTARMRKSLLTLPLDPSKQHVLDGGVIRHFSIGKGHPIVLWDILVHDSQYLIGSTYRERYALLKSICGGPSRYERSTGRDVALLFPEIFGLLRFSRMALMSDFGMRAKQTAWKEFSSKTPPESSLRH